MTASSIMRGFPPAKDDRVTLANWRTAPWCHWAFHHVRELIPTAAIRGRPGRCFETDACDVMDVEFTDEDNRTWTMREFLPHAATDAMVILRGGRVACEWYAGVQDGTLPHLLFSVSKSFTGALAGILVDRGLLDPDAPVAAYLPEVEGGAYGRGCTVRHVLDMTVSTPFEEDYTSPDTPYMRYRVVTGWNPVPEGREQGNLRDFLCELPLGVEPHGHAFHYVSPNSDLLGWVLERVSGRRLADLFTDLIWRPMGARGEADITLDPLGAPRSAGGISCTPRDLARMGELMRLRGVAHGRQVLPGWWVDDIFTAGDREAWTRGDLHRLFPDGKYRSKWYQTGDGALAAIGIHGQWIYVNPEAETVIAVCSSQAEPVDDPLDHQRIASFAAVAEALRPRMV